MSHADALGGSGVVVAGGFHTWLAPPPHAEISSRVPGFVLEPGSSRHFPDAVLSSAPSGCCAHTWLAAPEQFSRSVSCVPAAEVPPLVSRHRPKSVSVPSDQDDH